MWDWSHAHFSMGISDVRALAGASTLSWNGVDSDFLPGTGGLSEAAQGVHAPIRIQPGDTSVSFSFPLTLHGSESFFVVPFAEETSLQLSSNFPHPNFQGNWLPATRTITSNGFEANWQVSYWVVTILSCGRQAHFRGAHGIPRMATPSRRLSKTLNSG
jgi:inner membrane protein